MEIPRKTLTRIASAVYLHFNSKKLISLQNSFFPKSTLKILQKQYLDTIRFFQRFSAGLGFTVNDKVNFTTM